jgi:hypothetical protein
LTDQLDPLRVRLAREQAQDVAHDLAELEADEDRIGLPGLEPREEVGGVPQDGPQAQGVLLREGDVLPLLRGEMRVERDVRHADDLIDRRAHLLAQRVEELAPRAIRLLGLLLHLLELDVFRFQGLLPARDLELERRGARAQVVRRLRESDVMRSKAASSRFRPIAQPRARGEAPSPPPWPPPPAWRWAA